MKKQEMYEPVRVWFERFLKTNCKHMNVSVFDSHNIKLSRLIDDLGLQRLFPQFNAWDVEVDITAVISNEQSECLALADINVKRLTLGDLGVFLGYSRVVNPSLAFVITTEPPVDPLITLLKDYGRIDVLEYGPEKRYIRIAKWDCVKNEVIPSSVLPRGRLL